MGTLTLDGTRARRLPGTDGVWVAIAADSVIFAILFASVMQAQLADPIVFADSRAMLDANLGGINTLILLTSSWAVAVAMQALKRGALDLVTRFLSVGIVVGLLFVVSKAVEYYAKFSDGIGPGTNEFFMWYFTITGIHLVHVLFGLFLLTYVWLQSRGARYGAASRVVPECVASYWHLVDLLWIFIFPVLYLQRLA